MLDHPARTPTRSRAPATAPRPVVAYEANLFVGVVAAAAAAGLVPDVHAGASRARTTGPGGPAATNAGDRDRLGRRRVLGVHGQAQVAADLLQLVDLAGDRRRQRRRVGGVVAVDAGDDVALEH